MLELIANNQTLDIRNVSFNLTLKSPLSGGTSGSYIFSFTIPYSDKNAAAFGFPFRLTRLNTSRKEIPGVIKFNGMHIQEGFWFAKTSKSKSIQTEMLIDSGSFSNLIDGKLLPEAMTETFYFADIIAHAESQITKTYPEVSHNFPSISNPEFYGDANEAFLGIINNFEDDFLVESTNVNTLVPQIYLLHIIKMIYEFAGYTVKGDPFEDTNFQKALIYNNFALDRLVISWFYGELYNTPIGGNTSWALIWDSNLQDPGLHYNESTGGYTIASEGNYSAIYNIQHRLEFSDDVPYYYYVEIYYGSTLVHTFTRTANPDTSTIYNVTLIHSWYIAFADIGEEVTTQYYFTDADDNRIEGRIIESTFTITNSDNANANLYENNIEYKNHVPNIPIKDFLNAFFSSVEILPFFSKDGKTVEFKYLKNLLTNNQQIVPLEGLIKESLNVYSNDYKGVQFSFDFQGSDNLIKPGFKRPATFTTINAYSDLPVPAPTGMICFIKYLNAYYVRAYDVDTLIYSWDAMGDEHEAIVLDGGSEKISSKLAPMLMRNIKSIDLVTNRSMPAIHATGTSTAFGVNNTFPLRIMFYFGIEHESSTDAYPFAGSTKWRTNGEVFLEFSWTWESLISKYWESILSWYKRRMLVEFENIISPKFIADLNFKNSFHFQNSLLLLEEVFTKIKNKSFGSSRFKGWTK